MEPQNKYMESVEAKRKSENFPVASFVLPKKIRSEIINFYNFARVLDDISDDGNIDNTERLNILLNINKSMLDEDIDSMDECCQTYQKMVNNGIINKRHGLALISAFIQDTTTSRYETWEGLIDYCMRSASPVGRAVLEINQEWNADIDASDSICNVLQILNHLQDVKPDYQDRNRIYFSSQLYEKEEYLSLDESNHVVNNMKIEVLNKVNHMLDKGYELPKTLNSRRLKIEIFTILEIAKLLSSKLRKEDILAKKVKLSKRQYFSCFFKAIYKGLTTKSKTSSGYKKIAFMSKSSFIAPLLKLPKDRRNAMLAFYAYCRITDDNIDDEKDKTIAKKNLDFWRDETKKLFTEEIENNQSSLYPSHPVTRALYPVIKKYMIQEEILLEMLDGQEMDLNDITMKPSLEVLDKYCFRVASCVGLCSINIFGYNNCETENFAVHLGKALQLINIMRDVKEDAENGRIYLPLELLQAQDLGGLTPKDILSDYEEINDALKEVAKELSKIIDSHIEQAMASLKEEDKINMTPALLMYKVYNKYYDLIKANNYKISTDRIKISLFQKYKIAFS